MKLDTFINKLLSLGFVQNANGASNWYETYENGMSIFVGVMNTEIDPLGHCIIEVNTYNDSTDEEVEKDYLTTNGAWQAIKKLINI